VVAWLQSQADLDANFFEGTRKTLEKQNWDFFGGQLDKSVALTALGFVDGVCETIDQLALGAAQLGQLAFEGIEWGGNTLFKQKTPQWLKDDVTGAWNNVMAASEFGTRLIALDADAWNAVAKTGEKVGSDLASAIKTGDDYKIGGYLFDVATFVGPAAVSKLKYVDEASNLAKFTKNEEIASTVGKVEDGESITIKLLKESKTSTDELINYLKRIDTKAADKFKKDGKWPSKYQIPKDSSVLTSEGKIDWNQTPENGFVLNQSGHAIKKSIIPQVGEMFDRYGLNSGRFTSPIINGKPFTYDQRSLPYIEDLTKYHQYEVTGDFSRIKEYVDRLSDNILKEKLYDDVLVFYGGDWSKVTTQSGRIAPAFGYSGGGIQWQLPFSVDELQKLGLIKEVNLLR
uniref:TNT domain-containing protein n=1 Tax=Streptococcus equinus TaxID=1335 RepID=UPI0012BB8194